MNLSSSTQCGTDYLDHQCIFFVCVSVSAFMNVMDWMFLLQADKIWDFFFFFRIFLLHFKEVTITVKVKFTTLWCANGTLDRLTILKPQLSLSYLFFINWVTFLCFPLFFLIGQNEDQGRERFDRNKVTYFEIFLKFPSHSHTRQFWLWI